MGGFRRGRKPRVVWLAAASENRLDPTNPALQGTASGVGQIILDAGAASLYEAVTGYSPIVSDIPAASFQAGGLAVETLADIYSAGYRLRRVVGKIWVDVSQNPAEGGASQLLITVGLIVLRVDESGQPLQAATPEAYNPAALNNWADPYLWRRSWKMSNFNNAVAAGQAAFPENNYECGSVMDGPHVDVKTARVIGREERLFLVASTQVVGITGQGTNAFSSRVTFDLRCLASMRSNIGNRRNASR